MKLALSAMSIKLQTWLSSLRVLASFLLGITLAVHYAVQYLLFAKAIGDPTQVFEAYIYVCSKPMSFCAITLGCLLLLSDAPFLTPLSQQEMLRIGRRKWQLGQIFYLFFSSVLYSLVMLVFTSLCGMVITGTYLLGGWSGAMEILAADQPISAIVNFEASFSFYNMMQSLGPNAATLLGILFNSLYFSLIGLIILCVNLVSKRNYGWIVASCIHFANYMVSANSGFGMNPKHSLLCCALPGYQFIPELGMSAIYCFVVFFVCITIVIEVCHLNTNRIEPFL